MNAPSFTPWSTRQPAHGLIIRHARTRTRRREASNRPRSGLIRIQRESEAPAPDNSGGRRLVTMKNAISLASLG